MRRSRVVVAVGACLLACASDAAIPLDDFEDGDRTNALATDWVSWGTKTNVAAAPFDSNPIAAPGGGRRVELHVRLGAESPGAGPPQAVIACGVPESFARERAPSTCGLSFVHSGSRGVRHVVQVTTREVTDYCAFEASIEPSEQPRLITIPWSAFRQPPWGRQVGAFRPESMTGLQWAVRGEKDVDACMTLDDVAFVTAGQAECTRPAERRVDDEIAFMQPLRREQVRFTPASSRVGRAGTTLDAELGWGGGPVIEGRIDGQGPFRLVVDTGAELSLLTRRAAARLGLKPRGAMRFRAFDAGASASVPIVSVGSLQAGDFRASTFDAAIADLTAPPAASIDGVIGLGLLHDVLLVVDGPAGRVSIRRGRLGDAAVPLLPSDDLTLRIPVDLAGTACPCVLDTGSGSLLSLDDDTMSSLVAEPRPVAWGMGLDGAVRREMSGRIAGDVHVGPVLLTAPIASAGARRCTLGAAFFDAVVTTFDQRSRRVLIERPERTPIRSPPMRARGFFPAWRCGRHVVADVLPGSPAERAGLEPGATIVMLDGVPLASLTDDEIHRRLRSGAPVSVAVEGRSEAIVVEEGVVLP